MCHRRWSSVAALLAGISFVPSAQPRTDWPTKAWTVGSAESQGLNPSKLSALDREIKAGDFGNVDHLVIVRNSRMVVNERYPRDYRAISRGKKGPIGCGEGCDDPAAMHQFNYYHPNWHPYHQGRNVHTLQSVTKSITATVLGIAAGRGEITSVDVPFLTFFKDRNLSKVDARLHKATLQDLLTMRSGIEWHENDRPLGDTNTTWLLEQSKDWIQFTLDQPMDAAPGTKWVYNSGGSQLLSGIIRAATGRFIDDYARETLFSPLGIREFHWKRTPTGHPDTEGGLYLAAEDLAKIGLLYLRDGQWDGRPILPARWIRESTTRHVTGLRGGWDYGYQWWLTTRNGADVWAGRGFGGQMLIIIPSRDIVAVINAWNVFGGSARPIFDALMGALEPS